MKPTFIFVSASLVILASTSVQAQTAAPLTAPAAPAAAPATTPPADAPKKPFSSSDARALSQVTGAMQFFIKMGETAKWKGKEKHPDVAAFGIANHKQMVALWTPYVTMASERKVDNKLIPAEPVKSDKEDISKMNKAKDDKWPEEYYGLLEKQGKRYSRSLETVVKGINDPDLKTSSEAILKAIVEQTEKAAAAQKAAKSKK